MLRYVYCLPVRSFVATLIALFLIEPWNAPHPSPLIIPSLCVLGAIALGVIALLRKRDPNIESSESLAGSFKSETFICTGVADVPALAGFPWSLVAGAIWPFAFGLAVSIAVTAVGAPGVGYVRRRQEEIAARGSSLSLVAALKQSRPGSAGPQAGLE